MNRATVARVLVVLEGVLLAVAIGGLITMGAIVAPAIFRTIPAPYSGDGMAVAFARFDRVALATLGGALVFEAGRAFASSRLTMPDRVRLACLIGALVLALLTATRVTPQIAGLHTQGVVRGLGEEGARLEEIHRLASALGRGILALEVSALVTLLGWPARAELS